MKGLNKILNEMTNKATLTITEFSKKANFCPKWLIWQKLIKCLAKTHKWVDKKKACEKPGPVEIEPRVVPDLMVLKWQRNIWQWTWHCYQEKTKHFYCRWRKFILWLKYFHQCIETELTNQENSTKTNVAIETQVIPAVIGASEVINKTAFLAVFGSNLCTATLYPQQKISMGEKISIFSIIFDYVSHELKHHIYIVFSCFLFLLMGICCWTRWHFHVYISYNEVEHYNVSHIFE